VGARIEVRLRAGLRKSDSRKAPAQGGGGRKKCGERCQPGVYQKRPFLIDDGGYRGNRLHATARLQALDLRKKGLVVRRAVGKGKKQGTGRWNRDPPGEHNAGFAPYRKDQA